MSHLPDVSPNDSLTERPLWQLCETLSHKTAISHTGHNGRYLRRLLSETMSHLQAVSHNGQNGWPVCEVPS